MHELHAAYLFFQGVPIVVGIFLVCWVCYYLRAAVLELRAVRRNLETLKSYWEVPDDVSQSDSEPTDV
jgi:hypothetical protein